MKLKHRRYYGALAAGAFLATAVPCAKAQTQQVTLSSEVTGSDFDFFFTPVVDATDLLSISPDGAVYTGEGATMTISAITAADQYVPIFNTSNLGWFTNTTLLAVTNNNYVAFSSPLTIKGLRVNSVGTGGLGGQKGSLTLPAGSVLTFSVVPEPGIGALLAGGLAWMATIRRRRARS